MDIWALSDLSTPWCVHVVATLRVANHIEAGITGIEELAVAAGADCDSLHRVMRYLVSRGVFEQRARGEFALNDTARMLLDESARLGLDLDSLGGRMAQSWSTLLPAVRTGKVAYREAFGRSFWDDLDAHPHLATSFDALMGPEGHGMPDPEVLVNPAEWESVRSVVDVGGGTGWLLAEILRAHPHVRGILVELPRAAAQAQAIFEERGVAGRALAIGQSFFDALPSRADLYVLKKVLDNWPDREAAAILKRCAEAARPSGRVVIFNDIEPDREASPELLMMVLVGGKARSLEDLRCIAREAGLEITAVGRQSSGRGLVECRPI